MKCPFSCNNHPPLLEEQRIQHLRQLYKASSLPSHEDTLLHFQRTIPSASSVEALSRSDPVETVPSIHAQSSQSLDVDQSSLSQREVARTACVSNSAQLSRTSLPSHTTPPLDLSLGSTTLPLPCIHDLSVSVRASLRIGCYHSVLEEMTHPRCLASSTPAHQRHNFMFSFTDSERRSEIDDWIWNDSDVRKEPDDDDSAVGDEREPNRRRPRHSSDESREEREDNEIETEM
ncbi:hypothetical protein BLNAU_15363 [Blattamonas nauphoetae]|uniref:Uncharacterized protein n=1 Tax=Blattamonas nauphoetae TaxID=2049346 RepID=A0ABQ9XGC3_9EUKA|nr:hypothetical protein BLNAU_15363 [Blattamonas nauphoetae]